MHAYEFTGDTAQTFPTLVIRLEAEPGEDGSDGAVSYRVAELKHGDRIITDIEVASAHLQPIKMPAKTKAADIPHATVRVDPRTPAADPPVDDIVDQLDDDPPDDPEGSEPDQTEEPS